ncbi:MAG: type II toxin-antitoxin system HicA family toxin [Methanomicrobiales archaeon]
MRFPHDAPQRKVLKTFEALGFHVIRTGTHIALARNNPDGTMTPLTIPHHPNSKARHCGPSAHRQESRVKSSCGYMRKYEEDMYRRAIVEQCPMQPSGTLHQL